jgi:hypothetical protein
MREIYKYIHNNDNSRTFYLNSSCCMLLDSVLIDLIFNDMIVDDFYNLCSYKDLGQYIK